MQPQPLDQIRIKSVFRLTFDLALALFLFSAFSTFPQLADSAVPPFSLVLEYHISAANPIQHRSSAPASLTPLLNAVSELATQQLEQTPSFTSAPYPVPRSSLAELAGLSSNRLLAAAALASASISPPLASSVPSKKRSASAEDQLESRGNNRSASETGKGDEEGLEEDDAGKPLKNTSTSSNSSTTSIARLMYYYNA